MTPLVIKADLDNYKYVADSVKNMTVWPQFVSEAQLFDLKSWLGDALLAELEAQFVAGTLTPVNIILLNGGTYIYKTKSYIFQGLKAAIIYYAFARYTNRSAVNYTAAGIVMKDSDLSTPVSDKVIQRLETEARLMADAIRDEVTVFLNRNYLDYPLWGGYNCCGLPERTRTFKVLGD